MKTTEHEKVLRDARAALGTGDLVTAKRLLQSTGEAKLIAAIEAVQALESLEGDPPTVFATADGHTRTYAEGSGPYRAHAFAVRVLARLAFADWLAMKGQVPPAQQRLTEAKEMSAEGPVEGMESVEQRVKAAARKAAKTPGVKARKLRPRAKALLAKAKSWKRGTIEAKELVALAKLVKRPDLTEMAGAMDDYDGQAYVWDGDLVVDGDFRTADADVTLLVVRGDLVVSGLYDAPNEHSFVIVTGSLRAADVITASSLDVLGDLHASGVVIGDYNEGGARIRGDLHAKLFAPTDHPFRVDGKIRADFVLADGRGKPKKGETAWSDLPLAAPLELGDVTGRLRQGFPILRGK